MCCDAISLITVSIEKVLITKYRKAAAFGGGQVCEYGSGDVGLEPIPRPLPKGKGGTFS
jgi:hypothetical protein